MVGFHPRSTEPTTSLQRKIDMTEEVKPRRRGKNKNPAKVLVSIRLDTEVVDYFKGKYPQKWQVEVRKVLVNFINKEK